MSIPLQDPANGRVVWLLVSCKKQDIAYITPRERGVQLISKNSFPNLVSIESKGSTSTMECKYVDVVRYNMISSIYHLTIVVQKNYI